MSEKNKALVLGKGGFGAELGELLTAAGWQIAYLDDAAPGCLGNLAAYADPAVRAAYPAAFVGIGDNALRVSLLQKLAAGGYSTPTFVHSASVVCPSAALGAGSVVLPFAFVGAGAVLGQGCIVNAGALIDHNAALGAGVHAAPGAIIKAGAVVSDFAKVASGAVVRSPWET